MNIGNIRLFVLSLLLFYFAFPWSWVNTSTISDLRLRKGPYFDSLNAKTTYTDNTTNNFIVNANTVQQPNYNVKENSNTSLHNITISTRTAFQNATEESHADHEDKHAKLAPFWPNQVLDQYKKWHSFQVLQEELKVLQTNVNVKKRIVNDRKFALVYYLCPERAGNIFHNMFSTMVWAIITNRTILVKYDSFYNTEEDCEKVLKLADWIPRWDDWSVHFDLEAPVPIPLDVNRLEYDSLHRTVIFPQIPDLDSRNNGIFRHSWRNDPFDKDEYRLYIKNLSQQSKIVAGKLYNHGVNFLLGMLFRETFSIQDATTEVIKPDMSSLSIALHSRHIVIGDDGSFVPEELKCLQSLLNAHSSRNGSGTCKVFLMSDRKNTIQILSSWLRSQNCTPITVSHDDYAVTRSEHGPWSGTGFIQDLASSSLARTAVIGDVHRSSFMLLVELIEYDRMIQAWKENNFEVASQKLELCQLPNKRWDGYNYGPGTPTFRHHSTMSPLPPVGVLKQYQLLHSVEALQLDSNRNRFALVHYSCPQHAVKWLRSFFNGLICAVITNRTVLASYQDDEACRHGSDAFDLHNATQDRKQLSLRLAPWIPIMTDYAHRTSLPKPILFDLSGLSNNSNVTLSESDELNVMRNAPLVLFSSENGSVVLDRKNLQPLLPTGHTFDTVNALLNQGLDFLYGMLFNFAIELTDGDKKVQYNAQQFLPSAMTVALHSQYMQADSDVNIKDSEIRCLNSIFAYNSTSVEAFSCHVFLLSNRNSSLDNVARWLKNTHNCTVSTAWYTSTGNISTFVPGCEFYHKLDFMSRARTGFIGRNDVSSSLIRQSIEYQRRMEVWKGGRDPPFLPRLHKCRLN